MSVAEDNFIFERMLKHITFASLLYGELAQLARAFAWHARGQGFDSPVLHWIGFQTYLKARKMLILRLFSFSPFQIISKDNKAFSETLTS